MDVYILNSNFETIAVIDVFKSLIWTTRYNGVGDFELYTPATAEALQSLAIGNYLARENDESTMIIEKIEIKTDVSNGNFIIVTGRDLKSILDRRVIFPQQILTGTAEAAFYSLINKCCGRNADDQRKFTNFTTASLKGFTEAVNTQVTGDVLLDYLINLCKTFEYGFKITRSGAALTCELYKGIARPEVIFSPEFDDLINSDYILNAANYKNCAYIAGEGEGTARKSAELGGSSGLMRREIFVDARDISSNDGEIALLDYAKLLVQRGREKLAENVITQDFTGSTISQVYEYKVDYNIGDIVTVQNEYGITAETRIIEIIESWSDSNGYTIVPTFEDWEVTA